MTKDTSWVQDEMSNTNASCCSNSQCCGSEPPITRTSPKVGRNDPCPCGNGVKFKKCCGKNS